MSRRRLSGQPEESKSSDLKLNQARNANFLENFMGSHRRALLALVAVLAVGGLKIETGHPDRQALSSLSSPQELKDSPEVVTDRLIAAFEKSFLSYESEIAQKVQHLSDKNLAANIMSPFELVRLNARNPFKNVHTLHRTHADGSRMNSNDTRFFSYHFQKVQDDIAVASFVPVTRVMNLPPDFDGRSASDFLVAHHEITHSGQDVNVRNRLGSKEDFEKYVRFHETAGKPRVVIGMELGAYIFEIEALNLLLDGALFQSISDGKSISAEQIRFLLKDSKKGIYDLLLDFAKLYYPKRDVRALAEVIATGYSRRGFDVYAPSSEGGLMKIR